MLIRKGCWGNKCKLFDINYTPPLHHSPLHSPLSAFANHVTKCCILIGQAKFFYLITYAEELQNQRPYWKFSLLQDFKPFLFLCKCINMSENLAISREYWSLIPVNFLAFNSPCKGAKSTMPPIIYTKSSGSTSSLTLECEKNTIYSPADLPNYHKLT